jgi:hypothetical protein
MVFGEGLQSSYFIGLKSSLDQSKALLVVSYGWTKGDVYVGELKNPASWTHIYGGDFITYPIDCLNGKCYIASYEGRGFGKNTRI